MVRVNYTAGEAETYVLVLRFVRDDQTSWTSAHDSDLIVCRLRCGPRQAERSGMLYDAYEDGDVSRMLLEVIGNRRRLPGLAGKLVGHAARSYRSLSSGSPDQTPHTPRAEPNRSYMSFGETFALKWFRRLEEGVSPDLELRTFLVETARFEYVSPVAGWLEYARGRGEPATLAILQGFVRFGRDARQYAADAAGRFFERLATELASAQPEGELPLYNLEQAGREYPPLALDLCEPLLDSVELIGRRTGQMHLALGSNSDARAFAAEPFSQLYQRSLYERMRGQAVRTLRVLGRAAGDMPPEDAAEAQRLLARRDELFERFKRLLTRRFAAMRIRCHGDYRLSRLLYTGKDFVIVGFEGEAGRPVSERRIKHAALRDVADLLDSIHQSCVAALEEQIAGGVVPPEQRGRLERWARFWVSWLGTAFAKGYLPELAGSPLLPSDTADLQSLLDVYLLDRSMGALAAALAARPPSASLAIRDVLELLDT